MSGLATVYRAVTSVHKPRRPSLRPCAPRWTEPPGSCSAPRNGPGGPPSQQGTRQAGGTGPCARKERAAPPGRGAGRHGVSEAMSYPLPARVSGLCASLCVRTDAFRKPHSVWHPGGTRRGPCPSGDAPCASHGGPAAISGNLVTSRAEELCPVSRKYTCTRTCTRTHTGTCVHALRYDRKHIFNSINVA